MRGAALSAKSVAPAVQAREVASNPAMNSESLRRPELRVVVCHAQPALERAERDCRRLAEAQRDAADGDG